jgi:molybdopterin-containing oxidoreductase family iron-sulfur binding subunit
MAWNVNKEKGGLPMALNEIMRMHEDLDRALKKPLAKRSWVMVIDIRKCVGDNACSVSCMAENVCPPGTSYLKVFETEYNDYPKLDRFFMPAACQHCDNPPCMKAANKIVDGAITKRVDGIVSFNYKKLSNSSKAMENAQKACPYYAIVKDNGDYYTQMTPVFEPYEKRVFYENDRELTRKDTKYVIRKCTFCRQRIQSAMLPACVSTCLGRALYFGDADDKKSLVSELLNKQKVWRYQESLKTKPRIYYIGYKDRQSIAKSTMISCMACHE